MFLTIETFWKTPSLDATTPVVVLTTQHHECPDADRTPATTACVVTLLRSAIS
jgi:hypothetical protein